MENLRIVFMGTPEFATQSLKALHQSGANVVAVITAPDKPAGRGRKLTPSHVKQAAQALYIPVLQPTNLKDPQFLEELSSFKPDLQVVVAFRMLPQQVWSLPPKGTFNLHASLLPQYRGAAPINWAVINGEAITGVSTFFLNHQIDTGEIIMQEQVSIHPDEDAGMVHDKLMEKGAHLVVQTVNAIAAGSVQTVSQEHIVAKELKQAPKIFREDCKIDWNQSADNIHNRIRGLAPYPAAWTELSTPDGTIIVTKIYKSEGLESAKLRPGAVQTDNKNEIIVGTKAGDLRLLEIQPSGKKRMKTSDFLKGYNWLDGSKFI